MLTTRIIACLDVAEGRVVKSVNFVNPIDAGETGVIFGTISGRALNDGAIDLGAALAALKP